MKVLTKALIKESEENAVKSGVFTFRQLMKTAGNVAFDIISKEFDINKKKIAVICGNGNNGGDGFVIAKNLYENGADVCVIMPCGEPQTKDAEYYFSKLENIKITEFSDDFDIIIDAVFGIGLNRDISDNLSSLFDKINKSNAIKISIDIPSGVHADNGKVLKNAVNADLTVTFIALKPCFMLPYGSDYCGKVIVADIGVEPTNFSYLTTEKPNLEKRRHNSHKGTFGTALLICGSYGMAGAAMLSAKAALRSGLGIAKCVIPESIYEAFTCYLPEAVCVPYKQKSELDISLLSKNCKALLFGCGVGNDDETYNLLIKIIENCEIPLVLDADGINALSKNIELLKKSKVPIIITPHPAEMARLCQTTAKEIEQNRIEFARNFVMENNCILVLKGADTIIATPDGEIRFNLNGNPGMATGGSGDVLAGIIVSLLSQGFAPEKAAEYAVYLHGEAGDKAALKHTEKGLLASDIIEEL